MNTQQFETRKREHIQYALAAASQACGLSGLDEIHLIHEALPDLNFDEVDLSSVRLQMPSLTPFYIAGMTAGHPDAAQVNRRLAVACQERGWAMGVGSQRRDLEVGSLVRAKTEWQVLREEAPEVVLFANLGLSQLIVTEVSRVRKLVEDLRAQALVIHTNALQEVLQPEGTPQFRGGIAALRRVCLELGYPVVLKETGCGFSAKTLQRLQGIGLAAIDVSGLGGTHWGRIEGARAECDSVRAAAAVTFANWGEPTASSVRSAVAALTGEKTEIWASGGVRSGLDAAKLIALGAHCVGYAKPALEAAWVSEKQLRSWMETQEFELKAALFCTGSESCQALRNQEGVWRKSVI